MIEYTKESLDQAAKALNNHEILLVPTDTVYGVGIKVGNLEDLERLKQIKHRPETKPIPLMASGIEMLSHVVEIDERAGKIMEQMLPGALTLILPLKAEVNKELFNNLDTAAVRIPDHADVLALIEKTGSPLFVTSANVSGEPAAINIEEAKNALPNADGIVMGICANGQASTIVDCTKEDLKVLRQGPVSLEDILAVLEQAV